MNDAARFSRRTLVATMAALPAIGAVPIVSAGTSSKTSEDQLRAALAHIQIKFRVDQLSLQNFQEDVGKVVAVIRVRWTAGQRQTVFEWRPGVSDEVVTGISAEVEDWVSRLMRPSQRDASGISA